MKSIRNKKVQFLVTVTIGCTEPKIFDTAKEFWDSDGSDLSIHVEDTLEDSVKNAYWGSANVESVRAKPQKLANYQNKKKSHKP